MVHPQCVDIIQEVGQMKDAGLKSIGMTTNGESDTLSPSRPSCLSAGDSFTGVSSGLLLSKRLPALLDAGLNAVNISLDTLDPLLFPMLTRMQGHHRVIKVNYPYFPSFLACESHLSVHLNQAIEDAEASLPSGGVKVNCVIIRGVNDTEIVRRSRQLPSCVADYAPQPPSLLPLFRPLHSD